MFRAQPCQNTNIYHMVVLCSQMFANIKHGITVFTEHLLDVCEDSSKSEKRLCLAGKATNFDKKGRADENFAFKRGLVKKKRWLWYETRWSYQDIYNTNHFHKFCRISGTLNVTWIVELFPRDAHICKLTQYLFEKSFQLYCVEGHLKHFH